MLLYKPFLCTCLQWESCSWMAETPPGRYYGELSVPKSWPSLPFSERDRERGEGIQMAFSSAVTAHLFIKMIPWGRIPCPPPTHTLFNFLSFKDFPLVFFFFLLAGNFFTMLSHTFNSVYFNSFFNLLLKFLLQSLFFHFSFILFQFPIP